MNTNERKKTCPRCGTDFGCCTKNCWCSELPNIMPLVDNEDCLCYDCLKVEIDKKVEQLDKILFENTQEYPRIAIVPM